MERKKYIDIAKALCMAGVVIGHLSIWLPVSDSFSDLEKFLHMYQMPFFFFISGVHFKLKEENPLGVFLVKRLKGVIIPFVIWCLLLSAYQVLTTSQTHQFDPIRILKTFIGPLLIQGNFTGSWFIPCFFWTQLIIALTMLFFKTRIFYIAAITIIGITGMLLPEILPESYYKIIHKYHHFDVAIAAAGLIGLGTLIKEKINYENTALALLSAGLLYISFRFNSLVDLNFSMYGSLPLFFTGALSGIYLVQFIAKKIERYSFYSKVALAYIGKNSIWILFYHGSIAVFLNYALGINKHAEVSGQVYVLYAMALIGLPVIAVYIMSLIKTYREHAKESLKARA